MKRVTRGRYHIRRQTFAPETLGQEMRRQAIKTTDMASATNYSQPTISRMKTGKLPIDLNTAIKMVEEVNSPFLAMDMANHFISVSAPVINGDDIVKEPLAMVIRAIPEMKEAITAANNTLDELTTPADKVENLHDPQDAIDQFLDVMLYSTNSVAFICREYKLNMQQELANRTKEWHRLGIVGD